MQVPESSIIAAFDFDNTLTTRDSLLPFLFYSTNKFKACFYLILLLPAFISFLLKIKTRQEVKEKILSRFFKGISYQTLQSWGKDYADNQLDRYLNPEAIEKLRWHQSKGHRCFLISASLEFYLQPWALRHGLEDVIASQLEIDPAGLVTGRLKGLNCWGPQKVSRLRAYLGEAAYLQLYAYGDSRGDEELLQLADYPFYRRFY